MILEFAAGYRCCVRLDASRYGPDNARLLRGPLKSLQDAVPDNPLDHRQIMRP